MSRLSRGLGASGGSRLHGPLASLSFPSRFRRPQCVPRHGRPAPNEEQTRSFCETLRRPGAAQAPAPSSPLGPPEALMPPAAPGCPRRPRPDGGSDRNVSESGVGVTADPTRHTAPRGSLSASVLPGPGGWVGRGHEAPGGVIGLAGQGRRWKPLPGTAASAAQPRNSALNNL